MERLHMKQRSMKHGFTLIELLVVISIIGILIAILLPSLASARQSTKKLQCLANMRGIIQSKNAYAAEYKGYFPPGR